MLEIRPRVGIDGFTGETTYGVYDQIVLDGVVIGLSFRYENKVHWQYKREILPKSVRKQVVKRLMARNAKAGKMSNDERRQRKFIL